MHPLPRLVLFQIALCSLGLAAGIGSQAAAQQAEQTPALEPYSVFVIEEEAFARCGPSTEYYRTDRLRHGQQLQVYVETGDDWLGVRPPEDSFCWVPASAVQLEENGQVGEVIEDKTVAWIGTHLGRARRYRWQVQLAEGEAVTVIGRSERDGPDGPQLWYRIVPPSGEFRWIHREDVVKSAEELVASVRQKQTSGSESSPEAAQENVERTAEPELAEVPRVEKYARQVSAAADRALQDGSSRRTTAEQRTATDHRPEAAPAALAGASVLRRSEPPRREPAATAGGAAVEPARRGELVGSGLRRQWQSSADAPASGDVSRVSGGSAVAGGDGWTFAESEEDRTRRAEEARAVAPAAGEMPRDPSGVRSALHVPARAGGVARAADQAYAAGQQRRRASANELSPEAAAAVEQLRRELAGADVAQMQMVLSRLMARQASAAELGPVIEAASRWAASTSDELTSVRAELLAQRAREYQEVARRRGTPLAGPARTAAVIPASAETALSIPAPVAPQSAPQTAAPLAPPEPTAGGEGAAEQFLESGFLVQVYSARPNSPPFALTDATGRTVAYVTPSPGVNLRTHLNSEIRVAGNQGFLQGLNTPHILATRAVRTQP